MEGYSRRNPWDGDMEHRNSDGSSAGYSRREPMGDDIDHRNPNGSSAGYSRTNPWSGDIDHRNPDGSSAGYSRQDPMSGDMHHYAPDGSMTGYSRVDPMSGDIDHHSYSRFVPGGGLSFSRGSTRPSEQTTWERVRWGLIPALFVFGSAVGLWSSGFVHGVEVLLYPAVTWVAFGFAVQAKRSPWTAGFGLWALMIAWLFVRGAAGAG